MGGLASPPETGWEIYNWEDSTWREDDTLTVTEPTNQGKVEIWHSRTFREGDRLGVFSGLLKVLNVKLWKCNLVLAYQNWIPEIPEKQQIKVIVYTPLSPQKM